MDHKELFVYGTLMKGGKWNFLLQHETFVGDDSVRGEMYIDESGTYPNLFKGNNTIRGEVYRVGPEAYRKIYALEAGANYYTEIMLTQLGRVVTLFLCSNEKARDPRLAIAEFNAPAFFSNWLRTVARDSASYQEYLRLGGSVAPVDDSQ